jgi:hypothetical protein
MPVKAEAGWFIYALGSGWGHLNRALGLAQRAAQQRPVQVLTNSPYARYLWLGQDQSVSMPRSGPGPLIAPRLGDFAFKSCQHGQIGGLKPNGLTLSTSVWMSVMRAGRLTLHWLPPTQALDAARQAIQALLTSVSYDCLVVDTFPRGLVGELAGLIPRSKPLCRVLIHRDLNPHYVATKGLEAFVTQHYDGVLLPGESAPLAHLPQTQTTAPWLSRSASELTDPAVLRAHFKLSSDRPLLLVCATGNPQELAFFGQITEQLVTAFPTVTVRCLAATCPPHCSPEHWLCHWPGLEVLQLAHAVVGGGGYNLVHECTALGIPLVAFAMPRRYDRQARRIRQYGYLVENGKAAISTLTPLLAAGPPRRPPTAYANGIGEAIKHIETWQQLRL